MSQNQPVIDLKNVGVIFEGVKRDTVALDEVSFSVQPGESIALIGPSGCGKSTLLSLIAGILKPDAGEVIVHGEHVTGSRQRTSLILQDYGLLPWKTALDNAALGLTIRGAKRKQARMQAFEALRTVDLEEFAQAYPSELSGGMRQKVALARAIALDSDIMLMDEPLSALDALTREELQNLLLNLQQQRGYAQVLVTHSIEEAVFLGHRIILMTPRPGRVRMVIENPSQGQKGYRQTPEFYEKCAYLRGLLLEETDA